MFVHYLAGPLIGAVIGYCTNYIAVKMLFYPRKEIKVFGHRLPFTPGAIPKGKPRLAKAIGGIVGSTLVTKEDMESKLLSEDAVAQIMDTITLEMSGSMKDVIRKAAGLSEESYEAGKGKMASMLSEWLAESLSRIDIAEIIVGKGGAVIKNKVKGTMLELFLTDDLVESVASVVGLEVQTWVSEQGADYIYPLVTQKLDELEEKTSAELINMAGKTEMDVQNVISSVLKEMLGPCIGKMIDSMDISGMAEEKISAMSVEDLETLVLTVMKKELNTIVNLGALIGFLLGILNIFI